MRGAKQQAFDAFDQGQRPSQLNVRGVKRTTFYRYYQQWKKLKASSTPTPGAGISSVRQRPRTEEGGILRRYEEFLSLQKLELRKADLRKRAEDCRTSLQDAEREYVEQGVQVNGWQRRHQLFEERLDWVIREIGAASSEEALTGLEALLNTARGDIDGLRNELKLKLDEEERLRRKREVELSCKLLGEALEGPLFPSYVKKAVERRLLVRNEREAESVLQALCQWEVVHDTAGANPARKKQVWDDFVSSLEKGGWDFIERLRRDSDRLKQRMQDVWRPPPVLGGLGPWLPRYARAGPG